MKVISMIGLVLVLALLSAVAYGDELPDFHR